MNERIVAVGLLTKQRSRYCSGPASTEVWPVENAPSFDQLLRAIDDADNRLQQDRRR